MQLKLYYVPQEQSVITKFMFFFLFLDCAALDLILIVSVLFGCTSKSIMHDWYAFQVFAVVWI